MTSSWNEVHDLISKHEIRTQPIFTMYPGDFLCKTKVYGIFERLGPDQHIDESHFKAKGGAFFFKKPDHVADFIEQFSGKNIEKISCPVNSYHESLLMEKTNLWKSDSACILENTVMSSCFHYPWNFVNRKSTGLISFLVSETRKHGHRTACGN